MVANSIKTALASGAWVELSGGVAPVGYFDFSVHAGQSVFVQLLAAEPAAGLKGTEYHPGQGARYVAGELGALRAWARVQVANTEVGPAYINVTEE